MTYDKNKLVKLAALEALARRTREKLEAAEAVCGGIAKLMYQQPTTAQYRTKGGMTAPEAGGMTAAALGDLLDLSGLEAAVDEAGAETYEFTLNGQVVGRYTASAKLAEILEDVDRSGAGVTVRYDEAAGEFLLTAKEAGAGGKIELGSGLAQAMFDAPGLSGGSAKFGEAYGVSWLDNDYVAFDIPGVGSTIKVLVLRTDTIEDVAGKLDQTIPDGASASYDRYTGQLEIKDKDGAAVSFGMWVDDPMLGKVELALEKEYVPEVSYVPGRDGIFTAVKMNGKVLDAAGGAVEIGPAIAAAVAEAGHLKRKKVASLDEIDLTAAEAGQYIYMAPKTGSKNGDQYDEYMVLDGALEKVGSWEVELEDYVPKEEGKGLSSNDFTDADKARLDGLDIAGDAEVEAMLDDVFDRIG